MSENGATETGRTELVVKLGALELQSREIEKRREKLICYPHTLVRDDEAAVDACAAAAAHEGCELSHWAEKCPRKRLEKLYDVVDERLIAGKVELREKQLVRAAARTVNRVPFIDTDALRLVRAVLKRAALPVELRSSAEVAHDGEIRQRRAQLTGSEVLVSLCGNTGVGKTVAASYAIAREGGLYTTAYLFSRPTKEIDLALAKKVPVLVIDQLGRESLGDSNFTIARLEEVLDARYAARKLTILCGNMGWKQGIDSDQPGFHDRYGEVIQDRVAGEGVFVLCGGESLRGELRREAVDAAAERSAGRSPM